MANFYNPYKKHADISQGMGDMMNQFLMLYALGLIDFGKGKSKAGTPMTNQLASQFNLSAPGGMMGGQSGTSLTDQLASMFNLTS